MPLPKIQIQDKSALPKIMKWLLYGVTIFLIAATLLIIFALIYDQAFAFKFFPGVKINHQSLGKMDRARAVDFFQSRVDSFNNQGLTYVFNDKKIKLLTTLSATADPDLSHNLINFEVDKTVDQAYLYGRKQGYHNNFFQQMWALAFGHNLSLNYNFEAEEFMNILQKNLEPLAQFKLDARPQINSQLEITILPEQVGSTFDYRSIYNQTIGRLVNLSSEPIAVSLIADLPNVKTADVTEELLAKLNLILAAPAFTLTYKDNAWPVDNQTFKDWLIFKKQDGQIELGFDASTTLAYLKENLAPEISLPTLDAKFEIINGKVVEFQGSQDGRDLAAEKSVVKMEGDFLNNNNTSELAVNETKAKITTASVNDLGINEVIGIGHSDFSGSPANRRHNISVGAAMLNGILIKPDEEFSLITALGEIDAKAGYKPELVIKGDKTIPEYGGGLCQIGTTIFRSALASGLPITMRRPHSYRVSYYEPAGKDATIYNPWPDLKFINDTGKYILIRSRIEGNDLFFDFWGAKDGRQVEQTDSVISNIKSPGPTQYIETKELKPGEKKCTESAHAGADAYFDYKVTYPNGEIKEERFSSHYVPWPARCLIGIDPSLASSTEEIIE